MPRSEYENRGLENVNQDIVVADTVHTFTDIHATGITRPDTVTEVANHEGLTQQRAARL